MKYRNNKCNYVSLIDSSDQLEDQQCMLRDSARKTRETVKPAQPNVVFNHLSARVNQPAPDQQIFIGLV